MELTQSNCGGQWLQIVEENPETVCAPFSLLVCALRTVGVTLHPAFALRVLQDHGKLFWRWVVSLKSSDGLYDTAQLIQWWNDPAWLAAHPTHEFAIIRAALHNMSVQAGEIRGAVLHYVLHKDKMEAHIPATASPARREFLLGQLEGKIKLSEVFLEPAAPAA